jgi:cytosine/adenosine deaminase-related metal-dependent hydrolase
MAERLLIRAGNASVAVSQDRIVALEEPFDAELSFPGCELRPGLINAHDHLHRNHYGRLGRPPYPDAYAWGEDISRTFRAKIDSGRKLPRRAALLVGAWKNLFAGVTSVVHHDPWEPDFEADFPLHVVRLPSLQSLDRGGEFGHVAGRRFAIHLAEGTGPTAAAEVRELDGRGLLTRHLIAVHGVGMDEDAVARFRRSGAALVWCPSSNFYLFGCTAPLALLAEGVDVLLGSDSLLSGGGNLLDEIAVARATGLLSDDRIEAAVGVAAARRLGLPEIVLRPGDAADLLVLRKPLLEACAGDVELVMVAGVPRVARRELGPALERLGFRGCSRVVAGVERWVFDGNRPNLAGRIEPGRGQMGTTR